MATVPVYGPQDVQAKPANAPAIQADATPAAFGASEGQALQQAGQNLDQLSSISARIAGSMAIDDAKRTATDADTQWRTAKMNLTFGQNGQGGFYSTKGQGAIDAQGPTSDALATTRQGIEDQITDPRAKQMFRQASMASMQAEQEGMSRFVLQQRTTADANSSNARISAASQDAASKPNDTSVLDSQLNVVHGEMSVQAQQQGWSPEVTQQQTLARTSAMIAGVVGQRAVDDPVGANAMLTQYGAQMDVATRTRLEEYLKPKMIARQAQSTVDGLIAGATGVPLSTGTFQDNIHVESGGKQFDPKTGQPLKSMPGNPDSPVGVAQIKPSTAQGVAQAHGIAFDAGKLQTDPNYNTQLGALYHGDLMQKYGGNKMLADAAYNAGSGNVDKWLTTIGDPNKGEISNQQFASQIPLDETRAYVQKTGSATASASQMNGFQYPDFADLTQKVLAQTEGQPELRAATLAKLSAAKSSLDAVNATKKAGIGKNYEDAIAALSAGQTGVTIPEADIRSVYPPPQAEDMISKLHIAQGAGQVMTAAAFAPPQDIAGLRAQLDDPQSPLSVSMRTGGPKKPQLQPSGMPGAAGPVAPDAESPDQFRMRKAVLQQFDTEVAKRNAALVGPNSDPAAYVAREPTVAAAIASGDPVAAARASLAVQAHLGVPADQQRVLSSADAQNIVHTMATADPEKGDIGAALNSAQQKYGELWPQVYGDLVHAGLPATYQTLGIIPTALGRSDFQRAVQTQAKLKGAFDDAVAPADKTAITTALERDLSPFAGTLASSSGGMQYFNSVTLPSVKTLATYYASPTSGLGLSGDDAAARAIKTIIGDKYDIDGSLRTPKGQMGPVLSAGDGLLNNLKESDLPPGITPTDVRAGQWMTTPDDKGVTRFTYTRSGGWRQVRTTDGKPLGFSFNALPAAGYPEPPMSPVTQ